MTIEQRLSRLESRCRFQVRLLVAVISIASLVFLLGAKALVAPQKLQVTALEVVDAKGNVRISLGDLSSEDFDLFGARLLDSTGKLGVNILDMGQLRLTKGNGSALLVAKDDGASLQLSGEGLRPRAMVYASSDHSGIQLRDTKGEVRFIQDTPRLEIPGARFADPFAP